MAESVIVFARGDVDAMREGFLDDQKRKLLSFSLPTDTVKKNLQEFMASLHEILPQSATTHEGYGIDSFDVAVSINGKGQVGFLGTGGELGGSATLTLKFKRG
jgi:hypothetical protein